MKNLMFLLFTVFSVAISTGQTKVGDATLPNTETFEKTTLKLNGAGIREKLWIDLYAAGLYLNEKSEDPQAIIKSEKPMAIKLHIVSKLISSEKLINAVKDGFQKSTKGNTAPIQPQIDTMLGYFKDEITKNDVFDLVYIPSKGVVAYKNGEERGTVKGKEFKEALFGIWLSSDPADEGLKNDLLGK